MGKTSDALKAVGDAIAGKQATDPGSRIVESAQSGDTIKIGVRDDDGHTDYYDVRLEPSPPADPPRREEAAAAGEGPEEPGCEGGS